VEPAQIEAKLHGVPALGPGQVLIDLEVAGKLWIWPCVNNGVNIARPGFEDKVGEPARRERSQLLGIQPQLLHKGWSIDRKNPTILPAADPSAQFIDQVRCDCIVVCDHDLIVVFEVILRR